MAAPSLSEKQMFALDLLAGELQTEHGPRAGFGPWRSLSSIAAGTRNALPWFARDWPNNIPAVLKDSTRSLPGSTGSPRPAATRWSRSLSPCASSGSRHVRTAAAAPDRDAAGTTRAKKFPAFMALLHLYVAFYVLYVAPLWYLLLRCIYAH